MEVQTPGQAFAAFLGALGFTRPVEQLELHSVPLPSLLSWLSRPNCCNLVEATTQAKEVKTTSACRSMAIAVSEEIKASLKFDLPLAEMAVAAVDIRTFMNARLQELSSSSKLPDLIGEAATLMDQYHNRVWELVQNPDLGLSDVYSRVLVGLLARQPIEADLFPGILEGLAGNLGLSPAGNGRPTPLQTGRCDEAMGHRSQTGRM